jgi:hypothetical protein
MHSIASLYIVSLQTLDTGNRDLNIIKFSLQKELKTNSIKSKNTNELRTKGFIIIGNSMNNKTILVIMKQIKM